MIGFLVDVINSWPGRIRDFKPPKRYYSVDDLAEVNKILAKYYDMHSYVENLQDIAPTCEFELELPRIWGRNEFTFIEFPTVLLFDHYGKKIFSGNTKIGKYYQEIIRATNDAINHEDQHIIIDFRYCSGGSIEIFMRAFAPLLGTGYYFAEKLRKGYLNVIFNGVQPYNRRSYDFINKTSKSFTKPAKQVRVSIIIGEKSASMGELLPLMLRKSQNNCTFYGKKTCGCLSNRIACTFEDDENKYILYLTNTLGTYDARFKKYVTSLRSDRKLSVLAREIDSPTSGGGQEESRFPKFGTIIAPKYPPDIINR